MAGKGEMYMLSAALFLLANSLFLTLRLTGDTGSFPKPLSAGEERMYLERSLAGDLEARNILVEHNLRLVAHIIKKYYTQAAEQEDLISIGTIGLIKAVNTFRPEKNIKLATYASRCIENEILMYLRKSVPLKNEISIDDPLHVDWDGNELLLSDILGTDEDEVCRPLEDDAEKHILMEAIGTLNEREREIIMLRFGLLSGREYTQKEVADMLGISQSYISRLEKRIIDRLRHEMLRLLQC